MKWWFKTYARDVYELNWWRRTPVFIALNFPCRSLVQRHFPFMFCKWIHCIVYVLQIFTSYESNSFSVYICSCSCVFLKIGLTASFEIQVLRCVYLFLLFSVFCSRILILMCNKIFSLSKNKALVPSRMNE